MEWREGKGITKLEMAILLPRQVKAGLDLVQMRDGKFRRFQEVTRIHRFEDAAMPFMRLRGVEIRLVEHGDQNRAGGEIAQQIDDDVVSGNLGDANMEVAHQACQPLPVGNCHRLLLLFKMIEEYLPTCGWKHGHGAQQTAFYDAAGLIDPDSLFRRGLDHEPASAWADLNDAASNQAHHRLADFGARHAVNLRQLVFTQARPRAYAR